MLLEVKNKFSVATKFAVFISLVTGFVVVVLGVSNQRFLNQLGLQLGSEQMEKTLAMLDPYVQSGFDSMYLDLSVIAKIPCIQTIVRAENNEGIDPTDGTTQEFCQARLRGVLALVMNARSDYLEISYVSARAEHQNFVRQDRGSDSLASETRQDFEMVGYEALLAKALRMQQGEFAFLSSANANNGPQAKVSKLPTITAVTPIFDTEETLFGFMTITADFRSMAQSVLNRFPWSWALSLYDDQDSLLPVAASTASARSQARTKGSTDLLGEVAVFSRDIAVGVSPHQQRFQITTRIPVADLVVQVNLLSQRSLSIAIVLLFLVMAISFAFSSRVVSPLMSLDRAIRSFGNGDKKVKLPVNRSDEIGQIARSFSQLSEKLQKTQTAERFAHQKLQAVFEQSIDSLITIDASGNIESVNEAAIELFGYQAEEIIGMNVKILMPEPYRSQHDQYIANYGNSRKPRIIGSTREVQGVTKDGQVLDLELSVSEIQFEGRFVAYCGLLRDISERKASQDKLKEYASELGRANNEYRNVIAELDLANEDLRTFTYIVSHDLRAPLVNLQGFTVQLDDYMKKILHELGEYSSQLPDDINKLINERVPKATAFINSSTTKMQTQLDAILQVSRLGRFELSPDPVKLDELFESIFEPHLGVNWREVVSMKLDAIPALMIDEKALRIIATNICSNAIKYQKADRKLQINVSAELDSAGLTLRIQDNGRGIAADDLNKVFELFRRCGRPDTQGEGVGLTYTKTLVARMGGSIWCESVVDEGTTFFVAIPIESCKPISEAA